jgi:hypothetical protein
MSNPDTMTPLISSPWRDANGQPLSARPLPGLRPELIDTLQKAFPGLVSPALKKLLADCCGIADTELGPIDFTGASFPDEPCAVFQPCITLAIDDVGRRWLAEVDAERLSGPVWCLFPDPEVAVYVSDDLVAFIATLHDHASRGRTAAWLQELTATARAVWSQRRSLALRPSEARHSDAEIRSWLSCLPADAYVYDLRSRTRARGWPYGVAGPSARLYRCRHLLVFAAAGSRTEGWRAGQPRSTSPHHPIAQQAVAVIAASTPRGRRVLRPAPSHTPRRAPACAHRCEPGHTPRSATGRALRTAPALLRWSGGSVHVRAGSRFAQEIRQCA